HRDAHLVDPGRAPVTFDVPEAAVHQVQGDPSRQRVGLDLGHVGSSLAEPHETELPGGTLLPSRGSCFLATAALAEEGPAVSARARHRRLACLMDRRPRPPSHTVAPFARWLLWSRCHPPKPRSVGPAWAPPRTQAPSRCL